MGRVVSIVPPSISGETIRKIAKLHAAALRGEVIGIAFMADRPGENNFIVDVAGVSGLLLDRTRGRLLTLDEELANLSRRK